MAQSEAPHTRGFLFADLRGYTQFVETHGDEAASQLLSAYRSLVRTAVAQSQGAEIRTEGDGFYVVFPSASGAIRCAMAVLEEAAQSTAAAGGALPVGIGIHAGETADSAEGFVGSAVNIAARVCALAGPGELLITETVRSLVRTSMPRVMAPRGRRRLKGIREPIALFAMRPEGAAPRSRSQRLRSVTDAAWSAGRYSLPSRPWRAWPLWRLSCWR
jgi:class 3 adenylate cyclase